MIDILKEAASSTGVKIHEWAILPTTKITFSPKLLECCKSNVCGNYDKSWTCPSACESIDAQRKKILSYEKVLIFTTKNDLEDSFDYEGMTRGRERHTLLTLEVKKRLGNALVYGAGSCPICGIKDGKDSCAFPAPCPFPEERIGSIEAAGINVTELSKEAGISYNNGANTVTFFSIIFI